MSKTMTFLPMTKIFFSGLVCGRLSYCSKEHFLNINIGKGQRGERKRSLAGMEGKSRRGEGR
jgi:hypothetical protein